LPEKKFAAITLGVDGRIYCHDLTPELVDVLASLCREEPALAIRQRAAREADAARQAKDANLE
jgi:hypothetical protein